MYNQIQCLPNAVNVMYNVLCSILNNCNFFNVRLTDMFKMHQYCDCTLTRPSVECKITSRLDSASIFPAMALTWTPLGASMLKNRVGDSNLKETADIRWNNNASFIHKVASSHWIHIINMPHIINLFMANGELLHDICILILHFKDLKAKK